MLKDSKAYSGFAVDDLDKALNFYGETLGLKTVRAAGGRPARDRPGG